jgi:hypothetical protein
MNHRLCTTVRRPGDKGLLNPLVHWTGPFFASFLRIPIPINRVGRHASQKIFREMQFRGAGATATGFVDSQRSSHSQSSAGSCTSYRVSFKKSAASKYPSSKPHTLPSGSATTRSPVLQRAVGSYRTSRRYQRICRRLIPRTLHQASGSSRSAVLQIESRVTSRNGRARPRHGRRPRDLSCQGRPRPHDTRPCVDLRKTGRRGATRRQSHRPPPVRAKDQELDR